MLSFPTGIMVVDDGSPESDRALTAATELARATRSVLSLVHVKSLEPSVAGTTVTPAQVDRLREQGEALVERRAAEAAELGTELEHAEVRLGRNIEATVLRAAADLGSGLLVVGARGRGVGQRKVLGDLSLRIVTDAPCSVLVVREESDTGRTGAQGARHHEERR
ncbi:universal stress protein [Nocardiopsis ganjiahuensis]|uniref:universal stress protein n=1 Tax=Nocardiopsis ganjiahuensis TaxID=239984 RepID=UPI00034CE227|nr:universal stress protein [Nocardiopsis ganjiahuensis]